MVSGIWRYSLKLVEYGCIVDSKWNMEVLLMVSGIWKYS